MDRYSTQKIVTKLSEIWVWDRDPEKTHPESWGQKSTGSGSAIFQSIGDEEQEHTLFDINNNGLVRVG